MPTTIDQIMMEVRKVKTCSRRQIQRYLKTFKIEPVGVRQRPQLYPADAASQIIASLGLTECAKATSKARPEASGILTMKQLKAERAKTHRRAA